MKMHTAFKLITWITSIGLAMGVGALCALLVVAFVPAPGTPLDPILLLMASIGFGAVAFGFVWLFYPVFKPLWIRLDPPPADREGT